MGHASWAHQYRRRENRRDFGTRWQDAIPIRFPDPRPGEPLSHYCKRTGYLRDELAAVARADWIIRSGLDVLPPKSAPGLKRAYKICKRHGRVGYYDYIPYGLSNPISMPMQCGCDAHPRTLGGPMVREIGEVAALRLIKRQMQERRDAAGR